MAGLQPEQHVEVIDKAEILDRLGALPDVYTFDLYSGEDPVTMDFASARVGSLATAEASGGNRAELRGVFGMEESASLYGIIRVTRPAQWEGGHLAVVRMGAYNDEPATGVGILHPQLGKFTAGTDQGELAFRPNTNGTVGVGYYGKHQSSAEGHVRPAGNGVVEMLSIPKGLWVPSEETDLHMNWMVRSRPLVS